MKNNDFSELGDIFGSIFESFFPAGEYAAKELNVSLPLYSTTAEEKDHFEVMVEIPGVKQDQIDIQFKDDVVTVVVDYGTDGKLRTGKYKYIHRFKGVDGAAISAKLADGVLSLTLPKKPEAQSQKINIG